jgi:2-polyprenyl-3-methyl-5-hydroxy-6-metoxy-1,4-benzoquinol methylase
MYKNRYTCRACLGRNLEEVFDLGVQPLANNFTKPDDDRSGWAPLKVMLCMDCTMAQLSVVVDPKILYSNYCYVTSRSGTMLGHFGLLWSEIGKSHQPLRVLEVGSNDGLFLSYCRDHGAKRVAGIDPAGNLRPCSDLESLFIWGLFDEHTASQADDHLGSTDVIVARHVFGHVDNWDAFMNAAEVAANPETLLVIEVPYVKDMLERLEFDTIYHEHLSYISVRAVQALLKRTNFRLQKIVNFSIHGGAIALFIVHRDARILEHESVARYLKDEAITLEDWRKFNNGCVRKMVELKDAVGEIESVCGFGASAKSTVWMHACGFTRKQIKFLCDCTPQKQGLYSPGTNIPIVPESHLTSDNARAAVLFAWNFKEEIIRNNQTYLKSGGEFIIPGNRRMEVERHRSLALAGAKV